MPQSKITLIGMEQYLNPDHSVFENMILPDGIDKDTLIGSIILRCQEFELLFSDPDFMIAAVNVWSRKNYWTFDKWVKLINIEYNPLYNKDYHEVLEIKHEGKAEGSGNTKDESDYTRTDDLKTEDDTTVTHSEKAYNDSDFVATTEDVTDGEIKNTGTQRNAGMTKGTFGNESKDEFKDDHTLHGYGNIGITASQELFFKEIDVARFNMYEHIADLFCQEFCIMVY